MVAVERLDQRGAQDAGERCRHRRRNRERRQEAAVECARKRDAGRDEPIGRKYSGAQGQQVDQHVGEPEVRHRDAEHRHRGGGAVDHPAVAQRRHRAGQQRNRDGDRQGVEPDEHRIGQTRRDQVGDRHAARDRHRHAEIADERAGQPPPELHDQRRVESPALVEGCDRLGRRQVAERTQRRVAMPRAHHEEHQRRAEEGDQKHASESARRARKVEPQPSSGQPSSTAPN